MLWLLGIFRFGGAILPFLLLIAFLHWCLDIWFGDDYMSKSWFLSLSLMDGCLFPDFSSFLVFYSLSPEFLVADVTSDHIASLCSSLVLVFWWLDWPDSSLFFWVVWSVFLTALFCAYSSDWYDLYPRGSSLLLRLVWSAPEKWNSSPELEWIQLVMRGRRKKMLISSLCHWVWVVFFFNIHI